MERQTKVFRVTIEKDDYLDKDLSVDTMYCIGEEYHNIISIEEINEKSYPETHQQGYIEVVIDDKYMVSRNGDLGVKIAEDGRIWISIDGISFLRFKPKL